MYDLIRKGTLIVGLVIIALLLGPIMQEYMHHHQYYAQFLDGDGKWQHISILLLGMSCALLPSLYLAKQKKPSFWGLVSVLWVGLWLFCSAYVGIKADLLGGARLKMLINSGVILGLGIVFCMQLVALGMWVNDRFLQVHVHTTITRFLLSFALGLVVFLTGEYLLMLLNVAFPLVNWLLRGAGVRLIWKSRAALQELRSSLVHDVLASDTHTIWGTNTLYVVGALITGLFSYSLFASGLSAMRAWTMGIVAVLFLGIWIYMHPNFGKDFGGLANIFTLRGFYEIALFLLIILIVWYLYNGFVLAYIPYPTAWDANHAYMFMPKMYALHNGYYWNEAAMRGFGGIWLSYITFWFSLFSFSNGFLGISADTIAIEMNFFSGLFVVIFGTGLIRAFVGILRAFYKDTVGGIATRLLILLGVFLIWQWISSGMGAFLVFIDNKTDMGVLALIIVALLSGFLFWREYLTHQNDNTETSLQTKRWLILSGLFFGFAFLAKPTAMFDVLNFFLLLRGSWFGLIGVIAVPVLVLGILSLIKIMGAQNYFSSMIAGWMVGLGLGGFGIETFLQGTKKLITYGKYLLIWGGSFLIGVLSIKLLYYIPDLAVYGAGDRGVKEWVQTILLSQHTPHKMLLVQQGSQLPSPATCSLQSEGLSASDQLYKDLKPLVGDAYSEDVGRYVGYGWKGNPSDQQRGIQPFIDPRWAAGWGEGCHNFSPFFLDSHDAVTLCETQADWKSFDIQRLTAVQNKLRADGDAYEFLETIKKGIGSASATELAATYREELLALDGIMQGESMYITSKVTSDGYTVREVYLPYKYLNFFNITFNWSLQNLSSYYTDIGIVWLLLIFSAVIGLVYSVIQRERFLIMINIVTLFGWVLWLVVGGGILWYGIGIIVWSILAFLAFLYSLSRRTTSVMHGSLVGLFIGIFLVGMLRQGWYNVLRIATQGGGGPFMRYKTNYGINQSVQFTQQGQITPVNTVSGTYGADDVFGLQFPHYKKFLALINERQPGEGVLIAGTYARYFINNQTKVMSDQFLTELWQRFSDNNVCRSYLRLQDKGMRYLVIDPNIGTVVQGDGNKGLFERFFARLNPTTQAIEQHGTMSMLATLVQKGYIRYVSSNNLGAKYALIMPDSAFAGMTGDALTVMRAKMMVVRFFQDQLIIGSIVNFADQRVKDGSFFEDIADILGAKVRPEVTQKIMQAQQLNPSELTEDEKKVLMQFFALRQQASTNQAEYQKTLQSIIMQSLGAGNQIIVIEVVK